MISDPDRIEAIFTAALARPAEERAAYLDQACGGDAELRRRVEAPLQAHDNAGSFLNQPAVPANAITDAPAARWIDRDTPLTVAEGPGSRIGPYKLLQQIGEGGMGIVCMAEKEQPVRRKVALKIIKPGRDSTQVIACFEAERQALALMDHQNIARVLDNVAQPRLCRTKSVSRWAAPGTKQARKGLLSGSQTLFRRCHYVSLDVDCTPLATVEGSSMQAARHVAS
jgi:hypothetical protein